MFFCFSKPGVEIGKITKVFAQEVLDSRGNPTVRAMVASSGGVGKATAPSGASTGVHEALELRDGGGRYGGRGVRKAVANVNGRIAKALFGMDVGAQGEIDSKMCALDGTANKSSLGANATVAVSMAAMNCAADEAGVGAYRLLGGKLLPAPMMNLINGGKHSGSGLSVQEFMAFPLGFKTFSDALCAGVEVYHCLGGIVAKKYGKAATGLGDEGGFAPPCKSTREALGLLEKAIDECGYSGKISIALDAASSSFFDNKSGYLLDGKRISPSELEDFYAQVASEFPLVSIEDPFEEESFGQFASLRKRLAGKVQIVGDDLICTNVQRLRMAIGEKSASALLLKVNQIGTVTEALQAADLCKKNKMAVAVSHRSGESEDTFISDLAVGISCGQIKTGAPSRGERTAKYNRLLEIEAECGGKFAGKSCLRLS
jgi:enolase